MRIQVIYSDDSIVVFDKPPGLLTVPGRGPANRVNLAEQVRRSFPDALVVHRLDRDTSGLLVMARGLDAQRHLGRQFEERVVAKRYVAVVEGKPQASSGRITLPIRKDSNRPPRQCVDHANGRPAVTDWRIVSRYADRARLELAPLTGRSHQLRVHLAEIGHPVLGDPLYGSDAAVTMAERLMLHASRLTLMHPIAGEPMTWVSDCPF
jgi:tRNA pseudouridine32 synthase / 23S rRNA pseudouridine746 synthase